MRYSEPTKPTCEECKYLKYESDLDIMVCTFKSGCNRINEVD